jgi:hypothetical protein
MGSLDRLQNPVLVLNASYEPINVCAARRAVVLVLKGVAAAEETAVRIFTRRGQNACRFLQRHPVAGVPPHPASEPRLVAQEHPDARPVHVPVLPKTRRPSN